MYVRAHEMRKGATGAAIRRIVIYLAAITTPLLLSATIKPQDEHEMHGFIEQLASVCALLAFTILSLQFVLSARIKWIEWPFGLDILYRFHKAMGVFAGVLLVTHPVLMAWGRAEWSLLTGWNVKWPIYLGRIGLLLVLATVVVSLFPKAFSFEKWRGLHNGIALGVLGLGFVHSLAIGGDLKSWLMRLLWASMVGVAIAAYAYHKSLWPRWLRQCRYAVLEVQQETHDVWTLKLEPAIPGGTISYLPGQFHFLILHGEGRPVEEHPFTISFSPTERIFFSPQRSKSPEILQKRSTRHESVMRYPFVARLAASRICCIRRNQNWSFSSAESGSLL